MILSPGDTGSFEDWEGAIGILWVEAKDVAKHPTVHKTAPHIRLVLPKRP